MTKSIKDYRTRIIDSTIDDYLEICGAICIEGPKWCGKTMTSLYHSKSEFLIGDPTNNFSNRELAKINPSLVLEGDTPRAIDEWQEVPSIWDATRFEVDRRHKKGQFILTGSSTPRNKGILHSGTGRIVKLRMNTMSLFESGDSTGQVSLKELCEGKITPSLLKDVSLEKLAIYIVRGGWPENINVPKKKVHLLPKAYMQNVLEEDLHKLDDDAEYSSHKAELLLRSLARNESTVASEPSLLKDIAANEETMNRITLNRYLAALDRLFLFNNQPPFSPNLRSSLRVKQAEKRHFADPAMACALLNITPQKLLSNLNTFGFLFEALVEHDLSIYAKSMSANLFHYRDYSGNEIDAVIELENGEWCAFEIKLGGNRIEEAAANLNKVCRSIVDNGGKAPIIKCVICGFYNAAYEREDGVFVVPITALKN